MLISLTLKNWKSFRDEVTFSMIAGRERRHGDRLLSLSKFQFRVLPVAAIFGGNASGKSNVCFALSFAKTLVCKAAQPESALPIQVFNLDSESKKKPVFMRFEILSKNIIYDFSFEISRKRVEREKLIKVTSSSERVLYDRIGDSFTLDDSLKGNPRLKFASEGTRHNQLFLTNSVLQKLETFRPVYDWFREKLEVVGPDTRFEPYEELGEDEELTFKIMNRILPLLDTGIKRIDREEVPLQALNVRPEIRQRLEEDLNEAISLILINRYGERFFVTRVKEELIAKKMVVFHQTKEGGEEKFEMHEESDGTRRVIDLLPAFLDLFDPTSEKVYVIDELDRSLNTLLTSMLVGTFLHLRNGSSKNQLLFTTHDVNLMTQDFFRRDEIWVLERNAEGVSAVISLSEYAGLRYDKDIKKSYLEGRLGGVPRLSLPELLSECFLKNKMKVTE